MAKVSYLVDVYVRLLRSRRCFLLRDIRVVGQSLLTGVLRMAVVSLVGPMFNWSLNLVWRVVPKLLGNMALAGIR